MRRKLKESIASSARLAEEENRSNIYGQPSRCRCGNRNWIPSIAGEEDGLSRTIEVATRMGFLLIVILSLFCPVHLIL